MSLINIELLSEKPSASYQFPFQMNWASTNINPSSLFWPPLKNCNNNISWGGGIFKLPEQNSKNLNNKNLSMYDLKTFATGIVRKYNCKDLQLDEKSVLAIAKLACQTARKYGVDERLVLAVIEQESRFKNGRTSPAGAKGLMQLMPATAKSLGVRDSMNAAQNIDGGVRLLKQLLDKYNGNIKLTLAAYNAGEGNVKKYGGIPPFKETQKYVIEISKNYNKYKSQQFA